MVSTPIRRPPPLGVGGLYGILKIIHSILKDRYLQLWWRICYAFTHTERGGV